MKILELNEISKNFGSLSALSELNMEVKEGNIHAIIGPNGAGKTTLINIITGALRPTTGEVKFCGEEITFEHPYKIARKGIARTFQNVRIFSSMSVLENVIVGIENTLKRTRAEKVRHYFNIFIRLPFKKKTFDDDLFSLSEKFLIDVGLKDFEKKLAGELSLVNQRRLEIARALASCPALLLLDEPSAGMTMQESLETENLMKSLRHKGITIILISHEMRLVSDVADRVTVINFGLKIAEGTVEEVMNDDRVAEAYLGGQNYEKTAESK